MAGPFISARTLAKRNLPAGSMPRGKSCWLAFMVSGWRRTGAKAPVYQVNQN